jgi:hypothetical protein
MTTNRTAKPHPAELRERAVPLVRRFKPEHVGHHRRCRAYQQCFKAPPAPRGATLLLGALPGARRQAAAGDGTDCGAGRRRGVLFSGDRPAIPPANGRHQVLTHPVRGLTTA